MARPYSSPCDKQPRVLKGWLSEADVAHFKHIYRTTVEEALANRKDRMDGNRPIQYYDLLKYMHTCRVRDARLKDIIEKIHHRVEEEFGPGFVIVHDFWSYRAPGSFPAPIMHTDPAFWMTGRHDGFNLWFLLDHRDMAYGIDVLTKEDNEELYACSALGLPHAPPFLFAGSKGKAGGECPAFVHRIPLRMWPMLFEWQNDLAQALGTLCCIFSTWWLQKAVSLSKRLQDALPAWAFRGLLGIFGWLGSIYPLPPLTLKPRHFELQVGDAQVIRQDELHASDQDPLREGQFRLAIGFKFMKSSESSPVTRYLVNGPSATLRRHIRGLKLPPNRPLPDIYRMDEVDMAQDKPGPFSRAVGVPMGAKLGRFIAPEK
ncbi:unnamed protein product [Effrenium voratum]|nr:unnamed protein product [Effrenium voratum]